LARRTDRREEPLQGLGVVRVEMMILGAALTAALLAGCSTFRTTLPSPARTWPVVEQRARFEMQCGRLGTHLALANGAARTGDRERHYHEFTVVGCGRRAIYRAFFTPALLYLPLGSDTPNQGEVDRSRPNTSWTEEVELVGQIQQERPTPDRVTPSEAQIPLAPATPSAPVPTSTPPP
jgi:hypothetical protein